MMICQQTAQHELAPQYRPQAPRQLPPLPPSLPPTNPSLPLLPAFSYKTQTTFHDFTQTPSKPPPPRKQPRMRKKGLGTEKLSSQTSLNFKKRCLSPPPPEPSPPPSPPQGKRKRAPSPSPTPAPPLKRPTLSPPCPSPSFPPSPHPASLFPSPRND